MLQGADSAGPDLERAGAGTWRRVAHRSIDEGNKMRKRFVFLAGAAVVVLIGPSRLFAQFNPTIACP